jgi:FixJ family two-component response regulator
MLGLEGFDVATYASGEELLASLEPCACFVIDQRLPGLTGLALISRLRAAGRAEPVLLITTSPSAQVRAEAAAANVEIIEKPLIDEALANALRRLTELPDD